MSQWSWLLLHRLVLSVLFIVVFVGHHTHVHFLKYHIDWNIWKLKIFAPVTDMLNHVWKIIVNIWCAASNGEPIVQVVISFTQASLRIGHLHVCWLTAKLNVFPFSFSLNMELLLKPRPKQTFVIVTGKVFDDAQYCWNVCIISEYHFLGLSSLYEYHKRLIQFASVLC